MTIPPSLESAIEAFAPNDRIDLIGPWASYPGGRWSFPITARLSVPPGNGMPHESGWLILARAHRGGFRIRIYPDATSGIKATYAHQSRNRENPDGNPWRMGKPCLNRPLAALKRDGWAAEPANVEDALGWMLLRLLDWVDAAATNALIQLGEPFELPIFAHQHGMSVIGFREAPEEFSRWTEFQDQWGFARVGLVRGAQNAEAITAFEDRDSRTVLSAAWGPAIDTQSGLPNAVWCRLPRPPIMPPWQFPETWAELAATCAGMAVDLPELIADAGARLRRLKCYDEKSFSRLLLGFPTGEKWGDLPTRMHWLAMDGLELTGRIAFPKGTDFAAERRARDRTLASDERPLVWWPTANWASDQLRSRGAAEPEVQAKSVLVIGCGALGTPIAEMLLRMGVTRLGVMDGDRVEAGNLSRLQLTMADVGHLKATALARRLGSAMPDTNVIAIPHYFPSANEASRAAIESFDVIVDCTGSDELLDELGEYEWGNERIFISLGMTWAAEGLVAYSASESAFPSVDARSFFSEVAPAGEADAMPMEGIGCWHPVFPARADETLFWAAEGAHFIREALVKPSRRRVLFRRLENGGIQRDDH